MDITTAVVGNDSLYVTSKRRMVSKESLKLLHDEYRLFLQIIWSGVLALIIALIGGVIAGTAVIGLAVAVVLSATLAVAAITITTSVFLNKFNEIRSVMEAT